jgi:hypothetical protein
MNPQQYTQNLSLIPTQYPHVYDVALKLDFQTRYIGKLNKSGEGTFYTKRKESHLHRKTNSLGINYELLQGNSFKWISIDYCGKKLITTKKYFLRYGRVFNFHKAGFELQCFLPLELWGREKALDFENSLPNQGSLFEEVA